MNFVKMKIIYAIANRLYKNGHGREEERLRVWLEPVTQQPVGVAEEAVCL